MASFPAAFRVSHRGTYQEGRPGEKRKAVEHYYRLYREQIVRAAKDKAYATLVQFGAGNIGRSFIGQLFANSGYDVIFIDVAKPLVEALNAQRNTHRHKRSGLRR